jgi:hypothetical protein
MSCCGWVKLNVVFLGWFVCWKNTSFNFTKRCLFARMLAQKFNDKSSMRLACNGLRLKKVGDFEAQTLF